ncbi:MAG: recombinase family protein [Candidatus Peribacteraceae bacterium]|nr:recombinase family protein [Candidatus Peribacteraceae bacterium]
MKKAVIYCRVSSDRQVREGHGLDGQESSCRKYAEMKGYEVAKVFRDEGISGGTIDRPGIQELIDYLAAKGGKNKEMVVIVDDLKRLARDVIGHLQLHKLIRSHHGVLESPSHTFEESPEGSFVETLLAATAQLEREQNKRQVIRRMKARLEAGYWSFDNPPGYRYESVEGHGRLLVPDEPKASLIREALEGFASGRFLTLTEVRDFLASKDFTHRGQKGSVYVEQIKRLITRVLYAGYVEYPKWGIALRKGHHQPLIDMETYERIQERLSGRRKPRIRKDIHDDFPLRGFVLCAGCERPFTASWSKGRNKRFGYYRCITQGCPCQDKSVRMEKMTKEFEALLKPLNPRPNILKVLTHEMMVHWESNIIDVDAINKRRAEKQKDVENDIKFFTDRLKETRTPALVHVYEEKILELDAERTRLGEKVMPKKKPDFDFGTALNGAMAFISEPYTMWKTGDLSQRRLVLRMVFEEPLVYDMATGFGTAKFSLPINLACIMELDALEVVEMPGIEPGSNV